MTLPLVAVCMFTGQIRGHEAQLLMAKKPETPVEGALSEKSKTGVNKKRLAVGIGLMATMPAGIGFESFLSTRVGRGWLDSAYAQLTTLRRYNADPIIGVFVVFPLQYLH